MKRIIQQNMAIDAVRNVLESFDLPYKEIGEENYDYENSKATDYPKCYTFRFETVNYIHIVLDEETYIYEDGLHFETKYITVTDQFVNLKFWIARQAAEYKQSRY